MDKKKLTIRQIAMVGVMAAMVFAACNASINITLAFDVTRIHLGNSVILLAGLILGGKKGGFAAGIGAFLFDLTNPLYVSSALFTLGSRYLMAWICGFIAYSGGKGGLNLKRNIIAAVTASVFYVTLYLTKSFVEALTLQKGLWNAISIIISGSSNMSGADVANSLTIVSQKAAASVTNAIIGTAISVPLSFAIRKAMAKTNIAV